MTNRSWLFVPGDSPAKIEKAGGSGADALILDLEDSVALPRKEEARKIVAETLFSRQAPVQYWVRVNPLSSGITLADLAAVAAAKPDGIVLPKSERGADVTTLSNYLDAFEAAAGIAPGHIKILAIATETAASVFNLGSYDLKNPRLAGLTWGAEDLPASVGAVSGRHADKSLTDLCKIARSLCIAGAAAADVAAIDTVYPDFRDLDGLREYAAQGRREGFSGMMAIHPAQVAPINEVMSPSETELAHAREIIAAFEANPNAGVVAIGGKMIDMPHLKQARRIVGSVR